MQQDDYYKLHSINHLTDSTYVLKIVKKDIEFLPGQHILLGIKGSFEQREYSIYSGIDDEFLEVLVKEIEDGHVSKKLKRLQPGDLLSIDGPVGFFTINKDLVAQKKAFLFVATGTGVAPFHSIIKSQPGLNYKLVHGIRYASEAYGIADYQRDRYHICSSRDKAGDFKGYVSTYLKQQQFDKDTICYFCGNFNMIREAMSIMEAKGIPQDQLHTEVYF